MKQLLSLLMAGFSFAAFSQDSILHCGSKKVRFENSDKDHFEMVMNCPYKEVDTSAIPPTIRDKSRQYLIERSGLDFMPFIRFHRCAVVDFDHYKEAGTTIPGMDTSKADKRIKYAMQYFIYIQASLKYYFTQVMDKDGNLLSPYYVPDWRMNHAFLRLLDVCQATFLAEADTVFTGPIESLSIDYMPAQNAFVWVMKKSPLVDKDKAVIRRYLVYHASKGTLINRQWVKTGTYQLGY